MDKDSAMSNQAWDRGDTLKEDFQEFAKRCQGSEEELADIAQARLNFERNTEQPTESVLHTRPTEEPRIRNVVQQTNHTGEGPAYDAFAKESKQNLNARTRMVREEANTQK